MFLPSGEAGNDMATAQIAPERIAVVAFVGAQSFGPPQAAVNGQGVNCFQDRFLVVVVSSRDRAGQRVAGRVTDN